MSYHNKIPVATGKAGPGASLIESIRQYLADNMSTDLHAASVADKFKLSISSLQHLFKKYQGNTYHQYLEEIRLQKAFELIRHGERIKEVMNITGYKNRSAFHSAFKKKFKHTPRFYRQ